MKKHTRQQNDTDVINEDSTSCAQLAKCIQRQAEKTVTLLSQGHDQNVTS